ncbi:MAG: hypothetical protein U1E15_11885 [Hyphomicrobiales bacterium]
MIVELMGASGAGKSTLVAAVLKTREGARWVDAARLAGPRPETCPPWHDSFLARKKDWLRQQGHADSVAAEQLDIAAAQLQVECLAEADPRRHILSAEGIMQMFSGELLEDSQAGDRMAQRLLAARHAVLLICDPEAVVRNVLKRRQTGPARPLMDHLSADEIHANAVAFEMHLRNLARETNRRGGTCMMLHAEDGFESCVEQLEDYLQIARTVAEARPPQPV